jgi:hypothetical protein
MPSLLEWVRQNIMLLTLNLQYRLLRNLVYFIQTKVVTMSMDYDYHYVWMWKYRPWGRLFSEKKSS